MLLRSVVLLYIATVAWRRARCTALPPRRWWYDERMALNYEEE